MNRCRSIKTALLLLLLVSKVPAQEVQQAQGKFWTQKQISDTSVNFVLGGIDAGLTCATIANGGREIWMPIHSCAGVTSAIIGGKIGMTAIQYELVKHNHNKLARALGMVSASGSVSAIAFTLNSR